MAKDGVKRGFFFYFGLFILILLGIASVLMIVMMFMPKTNILGLQYFTNSSTIRVDKTTDESQMPIDFNNPSFNSVTINTDFADVTVQKNNEYERNGIYFVNKSRGFVTTKQANDFSYSAVIEDGILKISIEEEKAFLYFSKEIEVIFQIANENISPLANKSVSVYTSSGDVDIGGGYGAGHSHALLLENLNVETGSGSINISTHGANDYSTLALKTRSGDITVSHPSIRADVMHFETTNGDISATKIESPNPVYVIANKGKIEISEINASARFKVVDSYIKIATIQGSADFADSAGKFNSADINIGYVKNDLTATEAANADFNLGTVAGKVRIETDGGNIAIGGKVLSNWILKTGSGKIEAEINQNADGVNISTEKGNLAITFQSGFSNAVISNQKGKTNLTMVENSKYKIKFMNYDSDDKFDLSTFDFKNVNFNREIEKKNPLINNDGGTYESSLTLKCNGKVNFNWTKSA